MIEILEMTVPEINRLVSRIGYGHLACSLEDQPYVVPIHYSYHNAEFLFYTTAGKKTAVIDANPRVCLQIEEVKDNASWKSVIVFGNAEKIVENDEREMAISWVSATNPGLTPAIGIRWVDNWIRENIEAVYRITPNQMTGRYSKKVLRKGAVA